MKLNFKIVLLLILGSSAFAKAQLSTFNDASKEFFAAYVNDGNVDYNAIKKNQNKLKVALSALKTTDFESLSVIEREAVHVNAYNLFVIKEIVDAYPVKSVKDVPEFFDLKIHNLGGKMVSLNQLEKEILFKETWDERLHFVLVCGAVSCPPLSKKIFTAANTELMLNRLTRRAINNPSIVRLNMHEKKVLVSRIFDWYNADFTKSKTLIEYLNTYRDQKIPDGFTVEYLDYDWSLNGK